MAEQNIRCRKCRIVLFSAQDYPVLNAHGEEFGAHSEGESTLPPECTNCSSLTDRSLIYFYEDPLPDFLRDSLAKGSWVKGKINCPKCQSRLGSFNFIVGGHCACRKSQVPPVHLQTSKVDYIQPNEIKAVTASHPDHPLSQADASYLLNPCAEILMRDGQFDDLDWLHKSEDICGALGLESSADPDVNKGPKSKISPGLNDSKGEKSKSLSCSPEHLREHSLSEPELRRRNRRARRASASHSQCCHACHSTNNPDTDSNVLSHECCDEVITHSTRYHVLESEDVSETESEACSESDETIPDELLCPVCLDLLYSPMITKPCGHIFCEPCLRRLGKPTPNNTCCPLCRKLIGICQSCPGVSKEAKEKFPDRHNSRWVLEKEHSTQNLPLPYTRHYRAVATGGTTMVSTGTVGGL